VIENYRQFINWELRTVVENGVSIEKKLPIDPLTRYPIDHLDPRNWRSWQECVSTGLPTGFVLTAADPFFFLDMDKCRQPNGEWSPMAAEMFSRFPGAAAEISQSGKGLHIIGVCDQLRTANLRRKWGGWLEFYTSGRFVAFGPTGWQGDFSKDFTDVILQVVPPRPVNDVEDFGSGPVADYTGPEDDELLLSKAMNAKSLGAAFGAKASFAQLYTGDAVALSQLFPSASGDVWDRSSADAALMMHLAFWTGKDGARMDRLFRRSALMRDKYETRPQYARDTIIGAINLQKRVYDIPKPSAGGVPPANDELPAAEIMDVTTQIRYFAGCVYVLDAHRVFTARGDFLRPEQFKTYYGGYEFLMSGDGSKPTRNAYEAFTENRAHAFPKVASTVFRPNEMPGTIIEDKVNVYFPQTIKRKKGDVTPFLDLLARQIPNERDREIVLCYMAGVAQHIGKKFQWAPVIQGTEGNGKTFLVKCLQHCIGDKYVHIPAAEDLTNAFNSYLENKLLIVVEEIHMAGRREVLDTLKPLITNDRVEVQPKGIDKRMVDNLANWFFCTNYKDAVLITDSGRRYAMIFMAQQKFTDIVRDRMDGDYFPRLWNWAQKQGGFEMIAEYLHTYPINPEFDPGGNCHRAPRTTSTDEAIRSSRGHIEQEIVECVEREERGFRGGWISGEMIEQLCKDRRVRLPNSRKTAILDELGYVPTFRPSRPIFEENGKRPMLYVKKDMWRSTYTFEDYALAQNYQSAPGKMPGL